MKYKINDWVVFIDREESTKRKMEINISLYGKIAKIIKVDRSHRWPYVIEFKEYIGSTSFTHLGKLGHCRWCEDHEIKSTIDSLKFKKWIKG